MSNKSLRDVDSETEAAILRLTASDLEKADALLARARAEAKYSEFESYLEDEGRPNPYSGVDEWVEAT